MHVFKFRKFFFGNGNHYGLSSPSLYSKLILTNKSCLSITHSNINYHTLAACWQMWQVIKGICLVLKTSTRPACNSQTHAVNCWKPHHFSRFKLFLFRWLLIVFHCQKKKAINKYFFPVVVFIFLPLLWWFWKYCEIWQQFQVLPK